MTTFADALLHTKSQERLHRTQEPSQMPHYTPAPLWDLVEFACRASRRLLLFGPPSTGKTYAGIYNRPAGVPHYTLTLTEDTPTAELRGHYIPHEGKFVWKDGPGTLSWTNGGRLVLNEIDRGSPEIQSLMYAYLDDQESAELTLPNNVTIRPKESFSVVATMNGFPEDLPEALQSRFPIKIHVNDVHPAALQRLPEDIQAVARELILTNDLSRRVDLRTWLEFARLSTINPIMAAQACFGHRAEALLDAIALNEVSTATFKRD